MRDPEPLLSRLSAATRVVGVIGDPVHQSLSPTLHNAGLAAMGLDWVYVAFPVGAADGHRAVDAARVLGVVGLSVTMPHKAAVVAGLDELSPVAARLGVVNTVIARDGRMVGDSTDGPGFVDALRTSPERVGSGRIGSGWNPAGRRCLVLGTGGAARAVVLALAEAGAAEVVVAGRRAGVAAEVAGLAGAVGRMGAVADVAGADLVVNATPVGMTGRQGGLPLDLDPGRLGPDHLVVDLIYAPAETPLLAAAAARGAAAANGLGMLVHQAARQLAAWTGRPAPVEVMAEAGCRELERRAALRT